MPAKVAQLQEQNGLWREMMAGWVSALTEPSLDTFRAQKTRADPLKTVLGVALLGLVVGLWALALKPASLVINTDKVFVDLLRIIFFAETDFFILSLILYFIARGFGGEGSFIQHSYLLSIVTVPLGMIVTAFLFVSDKLGLTLTAVLNPLSPIGIVSIFFILFALYGFLLLLFALRAAHEMPASAVFYTVGLPLIIWSVLRVASMFAAGEENVITIEWKFISEQWAKGTLQELLIGHLWLVGFSVAIAVVLGVVMGVFITWPSRRPRFSHIVVLIPLALFIVLWAASSGLMGEELGDTIMDTGKGWQRSFKRVDGFFGPLLGIVGAIVSKPGAAGMICAAFTVILYALFLAGDAASELTLYIAGIILTIPSVALFGSLIRTLGTGPFNAAFALILYAQLPILRNTYTGIRSVSPEITEAGRGMGMTELQLLLKVKLPMAVPVIMTGVRVAIVMLIGITSIAAYIGNDTLGGYIFDGISRAQEKRYIAGAILVAALALAVDYFLGWLQNLLTPEGLKGRR
ncbi:MAG: ABC transporter permease subunit [Anaerolineales bacterium]|nr:ABC transporter permease subunit [Anaerolineales bacterium]